MNIIYLHGLLSSGNSNTATKLKELLPDDYVITPDIPLSPIEALQMLLELEALYPIDETIIIGTSMGAMYATQMKGYRRILVNPAYHVSSLLRKHVGTELRFFSQREDGQSAIKVTESLCKEFRKMERNLIKSNDPAINNVIALFGDSDDICNCREEYLKLYYYWAEFHGGHRLSEKVIKDVILPTIFWLKNPVYDNNRIFTPFEKVTNGYTGFIGDMDHAENMFKIYDKGVGREWFETIASAHNGKTHYDNRIINLQFPQLPSGANEKTVELVYGNRYLQTPSVEVYGEGGVQVTDGDFFITDDIHVFKTI